MNNATDASLLLQLQSYLFNSRTSLPGTSASNTDSSEEYREEFSTQSTGRDFQSH